jgi:hypothetical protein
MTRWSSRDSRPWCFWRSARVEMPHLDPSWVGFLAIAFCGTFALGCSKAPYELAEVTGKVTIEGVPFTEGKVMFAPVAKEGEINAGRPAFGKLSSDGTFTLSTYEPDDGAVIGDHWVTVIRVRPDSSGPIDEEKPVPAVPRQFERVIMPRKVTVVNGQNTIDVPLSAAEVKQYAVYD